MSNICLLFQKKYAIIKSEKICADDRFLSLKSADINGNRLFITIKKRSQIYNIFFGEDFVWMKAN